VGFRGSLYLPEGGIRGWEGPAAPSLVRGAEGEGSGMIEHIFAG